MSFVVTQTDSLAVAAGKLHGVGSAMAAHHAAAVTPTTGKVFNTALAISAHSSAVTEAANAIAAG